MGLTQKSKEVFFGSVLVVQKVVYCTGNTTSDCFVQSDEHEVLNQSFLLYSLSFKVEQDARSATL